MRLIIEKTHPRARLPEYATEGAAGMDLYAVEWNGVEGASWKLIPCGFKMVVPVGYEAQIRPRSGLALKEGVTVLNAPGTIDSDYRGEVGVILANHSTSLFPIAPGDRIAQMVIAPVERVDICKGNVNEDTERGAGGFGSTGK